MDRLLHKLLLFFLIIYQFQVYGQALSVSTCPIVNKLNNGNGQASSSAGNFPGYGQNNPVAANVVGTSYQTVNYDPASKTGNYILNWTSSSSITNVPVITRSWITNNSNITSLSSVVFGPPPPPSFSGGNNYVNYSFYGSNLPPSGRVTLEFTDPVTGSPAFYCTYDLNTGTSSTPPTFTCTPTISSSPSSQTLCEDGSTSFYATSTGLTSYNWQYSSNSGSTWNNITQGGNFTYVSKDMLTIANRLTYTGYLFRLQATNSCGTTNSSSALLTVNATPTAIFSGSTSICGLNQTTSIGVTLTGTAPWTISYTVNGTPTTVTGITSSPYYFSVAPSVTTTYILTSVYDANCYDNTLTGSTTLNVYPSPTVTPTNATTCYGNSTFNLSYSTTNSPNQYSISTGTRSLSGFSAISNSTLTATPMSITIPTSGYTTGTYDFTMIVSNSTSGCTASETFTLTINDLPIITATSTSYEVCSGGSVTLSAIGAVTYSWAPSSSLSASTGSSVTANPTSTTTYTATGTSSVGCTSTSSVTITTTSTFSVSISASATTTCSGGQIVLSASGASTYSWSGPSGYTATGSTIYVTPSATGTYTVTGTDINGCTATASQLITISGGPTITVSSNITICSGSSTTLTASGGTTYTWIPSSTLSASTGASVTATPTSTTTYIVYGTTSGCTNSASVTVTVTSSPVTSYPASEVMYCSVDIGASSHLLLNFTSSSSVTCVWEYNASNSWAGTTVTSTNNSQQYSRSEASGTSLTSSTLDIKGPSNSGPWFRLSVTSGSCNFYYVTQIINLTGSPVFNITSDQTICSGNTPSTLTASGVASAGTSGVTYTYSWEVSTTSSSTGFSAIPSTNSTSYSPGAISQNTWYRWKVTPGSGGCTGSSWYSTVVAITVATAISNNSLSISDPCTANTQIVGSTPTGGNGSFTYSWESSTTSISTGFSTVANLTSQSYTPSVPSVTTWYRRLVTSGSCSDATSSAVVVYPPIYGNEISNGQTICFGNSLTNLSVTASGGSTGGAFSYLWYSSADNSSFSTTGITTTSYSPGTSIGTTYYKVLITNGSCSLYSNSAKIVVNSLPTVTVSPTSTTVCSGNSVALTASGATSYTWLPINDLDISTGAYVISTPTATRLYTVTGTNTYGCTNTASATVTYSASPTNPTLSSSSSTICNTATPFDLSTFISSGAGTYEWFSVPDTDASYSLGTSSVSSSGTYYLYKKSGSCYSNSYEPYTLTVVDVTTPVVNSTSFTACLPTTVNLNALNPTATSGTTLVWFTDNTHSSSVTTPTSVGSGTYYLFAYSSGGSCYGSASSAVTVTVNSLPTVSVSSNSLQTCNPNELDLTSTTTPTAGVTYKWYSSNTNPPNSSNLILQPEEMTSSGTYYVFAVNNTTSCLSSSYETVSLTFNDSPTLDFTSPAANCVNSSVSLSVSITNGAASPTYQWGKYNSSTGGWDNLANGGVYSGVTSSSLSVSSNTGLDGEAYVCVVTSNGCSTTSDIGVIGVSEPDQPTLTITQPDCTTSTGSAEVVSYSTGITYSLNANTFTSSTTFSNLTDNTSNTLVAQDDIGCISTTLNFNIDAQPTLPTTSNAGSDIIPVADCDSVNVYLAGITPTTGSGTWSIISGTGGSFTSSTNPTTNFSGSYGSTYTLRWTITQGSCSSYDDVDVQICNQSATALPIELILFNVRNVKAEKLLNINWSTASEFNNDYFIIQRSIDGLVFEDIGKIQGAGTSSYRKDYNFKDYDISSNLVYYRIKQIDFNGEFSFSEIKSIYIKDVLNTFIYPNPSDGEYIKLYIDPSIIINDNYKMIITDVLGKKIDQLNISSINKTSYYIQFDSKLNLGLYQISILNDNNEIIKILQFFVK